MKLPETQNANHQYAFKKGYRLAQEGKLLSAMPSIVRQDAEMREYFQQGWTQFQEELAQAENNTESPWRNRIAWFFMMILAGIGTASLMVDEIQQTKNQNLQTTPLAEKTPIPASTAQPIEDQKASLSTEPTAPATLSLLNEAARKDLLLNQAEEDASKAKKTDIEPLLNDQSIQILIGQLTSDIKNKSAIDNLQGVVPKHVRKLYFFTQIEGATGQKVYHRWIYNQQIMATIPLNINASPYRTWSSKRLSSAWQGQWVVEVLNAQQQPIYRQTFRYVQ